MITQEQISRFIDIALSNNQYNSSDSVKSILTSIMKLKFDENDIQIILTKLEETNLFELENNDRFCLSDYGLNMKNKYGDYKFILENSKPNTSINITGNVTGSQIGQGSSFGDLEFQKIEKKYPNNAETTNQKESTISKLFKFTNHQVIGGLIVGLLLLLITWLIKD